MSKSYVMELKQVYRAIFADCKYAYPALADELDKDQVRLENCAEQRGIHVYMVDLPALGKHFDKCLADGKFQPSGLPLGRVRRTFGNRIPEFLRGLFELIFSRDGRLLENYDAQAIAFVRQILFAAKKATVQCSATAVEKEIRSFVETDCILPYPELIWEAESPQASWIADYYRGFGSSERYRTPGEGFLGAYHGPELSVLLTNLDAISGLVSATLGNFDPLEWRCKHGPGAVSDVRPGSNRYRFTCWPERLDSVFPFSEFGFHNHLSWVGDHDRASHSHGEPCSKLVAVPKTYTKPRLIASEPCSHQWCQQNIWHFLCTQVELSWIGDFIAFRDQTRNQELCLRGSVDGSLATVDLSAASDRVSCHAVGQLFRGNPSLLMALIATRTRRVELPDVIGLPRFLYLRKFATMGNACTFPVESLMFLSIALAAVLAQRGLRPTLKNVIALSSEVAVFGDDLVVPTDCREAVYALLEVLDFKVNTDKSFGHGLFRESCGVDAFAGINVTPAYWRGVLDGTPESLSMSVEVANNFYQRFLVKTAGRIDSTVREFFRRRKSPGLPMVHVDSGIFGPKSFVCPGPKAPPRRRWSRNLQRMEYRCAKLKGSVSRTPIEDDSALLQFHCEYRPPYNWRHGIVSRPTTEIVVGWVPLDHPSGEYR